MAGLRVRGGRGVRSDRTLRGRCWASSRAPLMRGDTSERAKRGHRATPPGNDPPIATTRCAVPEARAEEYSLLGDSLGVDGDRTGEGSSKASSPTPCLDISIQGMNT